MGMQKLGLHQTLQQKLSPQQIQFIKLLQVPTAELESRIEEELEANPALEEGPDEQDTDPTETQQDEPAENAVQEDEIDIKDYLRDDDYAGYKMYSDGGGDDDDDREMPIPMPSTLHEQLLTQLGYLGLPVCHR